MKSSCEVIISFDVYMREKSTTHTMLFNLNCKRYSVGLLETGILAQVSICRSFKGTLRASERRQLPPSHPTNQRCWFHASHESAHTAGIRGRSLREPIELVNVAAAT